MINEQKTWENIMENFSPGRISKLERIETLEAKERDFLRVIEQVDEITKQGSGAVLPGDFFLKLNARTLKKYLQPLKWRRVKSKKQAIEERVTPYMLMRESKEKMRMQTYYGGMGWRGLSDRRNKNFLLYSWIEGQELFSIAEDLINIKRYDLPGELKPLSAEERKRIGREKSKLTKRRIDLIHEIMKKGGIRTGKIPSRSRIGKFYDDMRMEGIPVKFKDIRSNHYYATWFDLTSKHFCKDKQMFITYVRPREEIFCAHDIAFLIASHRNDFKYRKDPYLIFTPFPKPNPVLMSANKRYRKLVFKNVDGRRKPLSKIDREGLLFCELKLTNAKFF